MRVSLDDCSNFWALSDGFALNVHSTIGSRLLEPCDSVELCNGVFRLRARRRTSEQHAGVYQIIGALFSPEVALKLTGKLGWLCVFCDGQHDSHRFLRISEREVLTALRLLTCLPHCDFLLPLAAPAECDPLLMSQRILCHPHRNYSPLHHPQDDGRRTSRQRTAENELRCSSVERRSARSVVAL